jgi:hypothetical protein
MAAGYIADEQCVFLLAAPLYSLDLSQPSAPILIIRGLPFEDTIHKHYTPSVRPNASMAG